MNKKIIKLLKKFLLLVFIFVVLINYSYAGISAADGSAFVTKSEFDASVADYEARLTTFEAGLNSKIDFEVTSYLDRNGIWSGKTQDLNTGWSKINYQNSIFHYVKGINWSNFNSYNTMFGASVSNGSQYSAVNELLFKANKAGLLYFQLFASDSNQPVDNQGFGHLVYHKNSSLSNSPYTYSASVNFHLYHVENGAEKIDSVKRLTESNGFMRSSKVAETGTTSAPSGYPVWAIWPKPLAQIITVFVKKNQEYKYKIVYTHQMGLSGTDSTGSLLCGDYIVSTQQSCMLITYSKALNNQQNCYISFKFI